MDLTNIQVPTHVTVINRPSYTRLEDANGKILIVKGKRVEFSSPLKELSSKVTGWVILQAEEIKRRHLGPIKATGYIKEVTEIVSIVKVYFRRKTATVAVSN